MPQLQAGIGAKGSILTRFIKPTQVLPDGDRSHRSNIIIQSWYANKTGSVYYEFQHEGAGPNAQLMYGAARLVKIHEEGPGVFTGQPPQRVPEAAEPRVPWRNSKARKLLYADVQADVASEELTAEEIYIMRPEYAAYDWEKFAGRLKYIRESVSYNNTRAAADKAAFDDYVANNPVSYYNSKGSIQWQGSDAQRQARQDIKEQWFKGKGKYRALYNLRDVYHMEFPFENFKHRIRQEIS
jgi:hypothetical protein